MNTSKIIRGVVSNGCYTVTAPIVKENYGIYLQIEGVELPETYQVDFSNDEHHGTSVTMIGNADGVRIPRQFIDTGKDIFAFLYWVGEDYGKTVYKFRIPNKYRPDRTNEEPTPEEQSTIDQAISALNTAVAQTAQDVISADASAQSASADADRAEEARTDAQNYATQAEQARDDAQTYANNASASATASAQSASQSAINSADAQDSAEEAQGYASASAQSASASANSASQALSSAQSASASAQSASGYASSAQASANTASAKAQDASQSASTASQKATESAQSASQALAYKTDAESAKTASQTAQGLAESARDSAITAKNDAEQAKADAESARDEAQTIVDGISGALDDKADIITDTASGSIASFSDGADDLPLKSLVVNIDPVQDLHGYDSPWPAGSGKNKFNVFALESKDGLTVNSDGTLTTTKPVRSGKTLAQLAPNLIVGETYKLIATSSGTGNLYIYLRDIPTTWNYGTSKTITQEMLASEVNFYATTDGVSTTLSNIMIMDSSITDESYMPYENLCPISGWTEVNVNHSDADMTNPTTITIDLGQTVYGGHLDVISGVLTVDRANIASYNGETLPSTWISDRDVYAVGTTPTTGAQVVYQLATPLTIQLDAHAINSLYGVNNIWADSGDTEAVYRADTKLFIERLTAPDSTDMIADANITSGQYFMVGNSLYKATANIANGSAIIVGTNCTRKSLSEALNEINA